MKNLSTKIKVIGAAVIAVIALGIAVGINSAIGGNGPSCTHPESPGIGVTPAGCTSSYQDGYKLGSETYGGSDGSESDEVTVNAFCVQMFMQWGDAAASNGLANDSDAFVDGCTDSFLGKPSTPRDNS